MDPRDQTKTGALSEDATGKESVSRLNWLRTLKNDRLAGFAFFFLVALVLVAVFAGFYPYDPLEQELAARNLPPSLSTDTRGGFPHLLGTDQLGRDLVSRLISASRVSVSVGLISVSVSFTIGVTLGTVAGFVRGWFEQLVMRTVDVFQSIPGLLIALFVLFVVGGGFLNIILIFALTRWVLFARVSRSLALGIRETEFVEAARSIGCSTSTIIRRHVLPNLISPLLVLATLEIAVVILAEAGLSFLGFGIKPPQASWGLMISSGREYLASAWWLVTFPGLMIFLTTLSLNLVASWIRGITDPLHKWRWLDGLE
ncbi:MAG: ABC transporter permease [Acidimicrobiia bacterium]